MGAAITKKFAFFPPQPPQYQVNDFPRCTINNRNVPYFIVKPDEETSAYLLYTHGNAEDIGTAVHGMQWLAKTINMNIVGYDYTGYGWNPGEPTESNCEKDILSIFLMLVNEMQINKKNIAIMGHSIGCGPSIWLANQISRGMLKSYGVMPNDIGPLISISGFTSCCSVVDERLSYIPFTDMFPNISNIKTVTLPILIIHGINDQVIHCSHAQKLWDSLPDKTMSNLCFVEECGHNDIFQKDEFLVELFSFVERYFLPNLV
ncbi:Peptidase S9 prolyl oligopeptidase catalytic domain-containing protein [Entamoeba marina]